MVTLVLKEGVTVSAGAEDEIIIGAPRSTLRVTATDGLRSALGRLASEGDTEDALADRVLELDGPEGVARLYYEVLRLQGAGLLAYAVRRAGRTLATLVPTREGGPHPGGGAGAPVSALALRLPAEAGGRPGDGIAARAR